MITLLRMYVFVTLPTMIGISFVCLLIWGIWELYHEFLKLEQTIIDKVYDTTKIGSFVSLGWFILCLLIQPTPLVFCFGILVSYSLTYFILSKQ